MRDAEGKKVRYPVYGKTSDEVVERAHKIKSGLIEIPNRPLRDPFTPRLTGKACCVYFAAIEAHGTGYVKIGFARNVDARVADLQCACPFPIKVLHAEPGGVEVERIMHLRFAHLRVHGEWFRLAPDILAEIQLMKSTKYRRSATQARVG